MKRPSFQFYPGDWLNDAALRMVSIGARGLWIDMMCIMHQGSEYGYLKVNGKVILPANLARMTGATFDETKGFLDELESAGVFSRDDEDCIFSRRMIRDEQIREARAAGGSKGGNPALMGGKKVNLPSNLPPTPSSSSSSSTSSPSESKKAPRAKRATRPSKTPLPSDFSVSDRVRDWAAENGHGRLDEHFDSFVRKARAKGYEYASWDDAFMEAIRGDWAGLKKQQGPPRAMSWSEKNEEVIAQLTGRNRYEPDDRTIDV